MTTNIKNDKEALSMPTTIEQNSCNNCGTQLSGQYCHQCGQANRSMIKFFGEVIKELVDDVLGYDSRLKHTILPLLFKPGKLTLEYIKGRRFYYVMPFKLYLITSLLFIFVIQLSIDKDTIKIHDDSNQINLEEPVNLDRSVNQIKDEVNHTHDDSIPIENPEPIKTSNPKKNNLDSFGISFVKGKPVYRPLIVKEDGAIKIFADEINSKAPSWLENPAPLIDELFKIAPYMMLFLIPVFALFQKLFYLFSKRFYIEHLILSLHNHSFLYIVLLVSLILETIADKLLKMESSFSQVGYVIIEAIDISLAIWIVAYIVIATKKVYQQGWFLTISKTMILGIIYFSLSMFGLFITVLIGAYTA